MNYTITSDSQLQNIKGNFEAIGNVIIKSTNNFEASSNKLTYDKDARTLKLIGNVFVKNLAVSYTHLTLPTNREV